MNPYSKHFLILLSVIAFAFTANAQIQSITTSALEIKVVSRFEAVYADNGTGADLDLSTWKPLVNSGFYALGHYAKEGYGAPNAQMLSVRAIDPSAVRHPVDYRKVYGDHGTGGDQDGAFWEPIAPAGYVALGTVATRSYEKPSVKEVVCIRKDLVRRVSVGGQIWNDRGSGGDMDISLWNLGMGDECNTLLSNSFFAFSQYYQPSEATTAFGIIIP
ncbi:MAG: Vps62-related protein [Bacteroidota bacterium]